MKTEWIVIDQITMNADIQSRVVGLDERTVSDYADAIVAGQEFPAIVVFVNGDVIFMADGFHRAEAARRAGRTKILCEVHDGGHREAMLWAAGANTLHGLQRSNADKRRAVEILLDDTEWSTWADRVISRHCGVSHTFVSHLRRERTGNGFQPTPSVEIELGTMRRASTNDFTHTETGIQTPWDPSLPQLQRESTLEPAGQGNVASAPSGGRHEDAPCWNCSCNLRHAYQILRCVDCETARPSVTKDWVVVDGRVFLTPFHEINPDIWGETYERFLDSVRDGGVVHAILLDERGVVVDGRQRLRAIAALGLVPKTQVKVTGSPLKSLRLSYVINVHRKQWTDDDTRRLERWREKHLEAEDEIDF